MEERLKMLRKILGLNQNEFSERVNIGQSTLAMMETGKRLVNERHIKLICSEFNVNEIWLRDGKGEMFVQTVDSVIDHLVREYHLDDLDKKILDTYIQLSTPQRAALKEYLVKLAQKIVPSIPESEQLSIDEEVEAYRRELEDERKGEISSPSAESGTA